MRKVLSGLVASTGMASVMEGLRRAPRGGLTGLSRRGVIAAGACAALLGVGGGAVALPATSGATGLPDGRVYEEVSPAFKNGNYVASGATIVVGREGYAAASADGDALTYLSSGALGSAVSSVLGPYVSRRTSSGWSTESATPPQLGITSAFGSPTVLVPSSDFSRFVFGSVHPATAYSPEEPPGPFHSLDLYLTEDPFVDPAWLGKPTIQDPLPALGQDGSSPLNIDYGIAGATPSLSTIYFSYTGTLIPQDESRAPNVGNGDGSHPRTSPQGFYEWTDGTLAPAGVLPDGSVPAFGAAPANVAGDLRQNNGTWQAMDFNNEVAGAGTRAYFVSPDPAASKATDENCETEGPCTGAVPELYVRKAAPDGSKSSVLISQSQLPGHVGEPAPDGPISVEDAGVVQQSLDKTYVYGSPDGSQAFFASDDRLTTAAPEDATPKEYDFSLETGVLTYLPGVDGPIVASSDTGSDLLFENTGAALEQLDLWVSGPNGGSVRKVAELPTPAFLGEPYNGHTGIQARASSDGGVFVFDTNAPIPGGFNNQDGFGEVYRYDLASAALVCVSCSRLGLANAGDATISYDNSGGEQARPRSTVDTRVISSDGDRVFFDTTNALVPQDTNGKRDVYEWEADGSGSCVESPGCTYLISSGKSPEDSFYLDNSESGGDVFFNTVDGLVGGDNDGSYDAYDARIPRPGDIPPPSAVPCQGDVCQGPPSVPSLLGAPASASFNGAGNLTPVAIKPALGGTKKKPKKHRKVAHKNRAKRKRGKRAERARTNSRQNDVRGVR